MVDRDYIVKCQSISLMFLLLALLCSLGRSHSVSQLVCWNGKAKQQSTSGLRGNNTGVRD